MRTTIRQFLSFWLLCAGAGLAWGQAGLKCAVCLEPIKGQYQWFENSAFSEKKPVCETCSRLETLCSLCGIPVKTNYQTLEDGRLLCEPDAKAAVFSPTDAEKIWDEARRDVSMNFSGFGVLPQKITVSLVGRQEIIRAGKNQYSWHDKSNTMGLTCSRLTKENRYEHSIYLINGVGSARLAAICAHEYAHAWLHENLPRDRRLEGDTVEGFCELVAYKLMSARNEELEKKVIVANTYTHGQFATLMQAEEDLKFYRLLEWFKTGVDERIDKDNILRALHLQERPAPTAVWYPTPLPTAVPDQLMLKGISGAPGRRFALINDRTLEKNEEGKVRVGKTNVVVRCLEISDRSVVLLSRASGQRIELVLRPD